MPTTRTIAVPEAPPCFRAALSTLHSLAPSPSVVLATSFSTRIVTTVHTPAHPVTCRPSHTVTSMGLSAAVRALHSADETACLLGSSAAERGAVESWIENAEANLLPPLGVTKSGLAATVAADFGRGVARHLRSGNLTYLVGDYLTAADVIVACLLAELMGSAKKRIKCTVSLKRWMETVAIGICAMEVEMEDGGEEEIEVQMQLPVQKQKSAKQDKTDEKKNTKKENTGKKEEGKVALKAPLSTMVGTSKQSSVVSEKKIDASVLSSGESGIFLLPDPSSVPLLTVLGSIPHTTYVHPPAMTVNELLEACPIPPIPGALAGTHTKNLFLKDKKHGAFLVTARPNADTNAKKLGKLLNLKGKTNLRFGDDVSLKKSLDVKPGHLGPMCIAADSEKTVTMVLDSKLALADAVYSHPGRNDMSTCLSGSDLVAFIRDITGHEVILIDFDASPEAEKVATGPEKLKKKEKKDAPGKQPKNAKQQNTDKKTAAKGQTLLALQWKKTEHFANWYSDTILLSEMISYYNISGCYILRPWSYSIWEGIQTWFNGKIKELGVDNTYFPLFVSKDRLEREADHVEGFAPEVAWVTKSGESDLAMPIAIRPTSETIMYPAFSDWIKSHRDLPLKINQWSNVVRWEFKDPTPFLRSREFLWQEGHTAHATWEDSDSMVMQALELYRGVYEDVLAVPVIKGYKTEKEKFAGGLMTTTCEAYIPVAGRAIQGATSHNLGQNFANMFNIKFQGEDGTTKTAWQTSWGCTTRTLGVMIMVHGDDMGLVLPPYVSPVQAVIVPIVSKKCPLEVLAPYCNEILADLRAAGVRVRLDDRDFYNPGWKYNHWEQKGVPLRIEIGPRDIDARQVRLVVRFSGAKEDAPADGLGARVSSMMNDIQNAMLKKATAERDAHFAKITDWKDFVPNLEKGNLVLAPWCGPKHTDWENWAKNKSREEGMKEGEVEEDTCATSVAAKTLCIPFDQPELPEGTKCFASGLPATCWCLWGRSY